MSYIDLAKKLGIGKQATLALKLIFSNKLLLSSFLSIIEVPKDDLQKISNDIQENWFKKITNEEDLQHIRDCKDIIDNVISSKE